jgi:hypothetical protein
VTPAERQKRELDRIFQLGQQLAATWPPMTDEQVEQCAFIIKPRLAEPRRQTPATLPQAA